MTAFGPYLSLRQGEVFDTPLHELNVHIGKERFTGFGRLKCQLDGELEIWAVTDGNFSTELNSISTAQVGQLMPVDSYYALEALDQRGFKVSVERLTFNNSSCDGTTVRIANQSSLQSPIRFERNRNRDHASVHAQVIFKLDDASEVQWLCGLLAGTLATTVGDLNLAVLREGHFTASLEASVGIDADRATDAVWHAIGVLTGLRANRVATQIDTQSLSVETVSGSGRADSSRLLELLGPLHERALYLEPAHGQRLFIDCINFFYRPDSEPFRCLLWALWNAVDRSFSVSALVASSVLEGFVQVLRKKLSPPPAISVQQIAAIEKFMRSNEFPKNELPVEDFEKLVNRVNGSLNSFNHGSTSNVLRSWCETGEFGLTMETFSGWNFVRNRVSHGTLNLFDANPEKRRKTFEARNAIMQGINSILMSVMKYEGAYFDWISGTYCTISERSRLS